MRDAVAIATPGAEHNHYSRLLELTKPDGTSLFKAIRIALTCPPCIAAGRTDMCEHRADLVPSWHSSGRRDIIKRVLEGDTDLFRRESLGIITTVRRCACACVCVCVSLIACGWAQSAEYFLRREWVVALNQSVARPNFASARPRLLFTAVDPGGGGANSSYALCTVALRPDETAVGVTQARACVCVCACFTRKGAPARPSAAAAGRPRARRAPSAACPPRP